MKRSELRQRLWAHATLYYQEPPRTVTMLRALGYDYEPDTPDDDLPLEELLGAWLSVNRVLEIDAPEVVGLGYWPGAWQVMHTRGDVWTPRAEILLYQVETIHDLRFKQAVRGLSRAVEVLTADDPQPRPRRRPVQQTLMLVK